VGADEEELERCIRKVLDSPSPRKLVVAGPGTGKTTLFKHLLDGCGGKADDRLVLTFINSLRDDLEVSLAGLAQVRTLHAYCMGLLHAKPDLLTGLTPGFRCVPGLAHMIARDWEHIENTAAPHFVGQMRNLEDDNEIGFYIARGDYYDAVDFDDSIYRTGAELKKHQKNIPAYDLVLIDEYQDFNRMEAGIIETLATSSPIVIAGDDDQALYSQLRGASWEHIRSLHKAPEYEVFELPFCMRCPEVIVGAVNDIISTARNIHRLDGRIEKPYKHFEPVKGKDSKLYPKIWLIETSVQRKNANYFGRFINEAIDKIPQSEIEEANKKGEPVVLIIGSRQYLRQIEDYVTEAGSAIELRQELSSALNTELGFELFKKNMESKLS